MNHLVHSEFHSSMMFSSFGQGTSELFKCSLLKNNYYNDMTNKMIQKSQKIPQKIFYIDKQPEVVDLIEKLKNSNSEPQIIHQKVQPFKKNTSRNTIDKSINNSNLGLYKPKYHLVYKKDAIYEDQDHQDQMKQKQSEQRTNNLIKLNHHLVKPVLELQKEFSHDRISVQQNNEIIKEVQIKSTNISKIYSSITKLSNQCKSITDFSRQVGRQYKKLESQHITNQDSIYLPELNTKKVLLGHFSYANRDNSELFKANISGLVYDIKYGQVENRKDIKIFDFSKAQHRKIYTKPIYSCDESINDISNKQYLKSKLANVVVPDFDKMLARNQQKKKKRTLLQSQSLDFLNYTSMFQVKK